MAVRSYVPAGWPPGVHPPGSPEFERSAVAWLLDVVPSDYLLHGVLKRHPVALASLARHHLDACVEGARSGYRTARTELGPHLPPAAIEAVLAAYRDEGTRLATAAQAASLVERALHGEVFVRQLSGGRAARPGPPAAPVRAGDRGSRTPPASSPPGPPSAPPSAPPAGPPTAPPLACPPVGPPPAGPPPAGSTPSRG